MTQEVTPGPLNDTVRTAILDSARDLFGRYGYKKTTMEDIAQVLGKGKSSLYYYFKNKEEIFMAVISWEGDILFSKLRNIVNSTDTPEVKMRNYVTVRMENIRILQNYHVALRSDVGGGFDFLEQIKTQFDNEEIELIKTMMIEGLNKNQFQLKDPEMAAVAIAIALKGLETPLFRSMNLNNFDEFRVQIDNILNILFYGMIKRS